MAALPCPRVAPYRTQASEAASARVRLLALHRRHAGLVRGVFYWLGADLEAIDGAVLRTFLLAGRHSPAPDGAPDRAPDTARAWLGRLAWRVATRPDASGIDSAPTTTPRLPPEADLLARFLATHTSTAAERAVLVLAEFTGLGPVALAVELGFPEEAVRRHLTALREALLADPEVIALGGPRVVLLASLAPFLADAAWQRRHAAALASRLTTSSPGLSDMLRRPTGIAGLGLVAVTILLLLRPDPPAPAAPRRPPVVIAVPRPPPPVVAPPLPLPVPAAMSPVPAPVRKVARRGGSRRARPDEALARREKLAKARDPGAIIVELEIIGAGRRSLPNNPRQALAYADQHARDYPDSQLRSHRAELRVRALCALGRRDEAKAEAQRAPQPKVQDALQTACKP